MILSKDFLGLIAVATLIAFPVAWWAMHKWLQGFTHRADVSWRISPLAGSIAAVIVILTISYQPIKAAFLNPLKSLKTE